MIRYIRNADVDWKYTKSFKLLVRSACFLLNAVKCIPVSVVSFCTRAGKLTLLAAEIITRSLLCHSLIKYIYNWSWNKFICYDIHTHMYKMNERKLFIINCQYLTLKLYSLFHSFVLELFAHRIYSEISHQSHTFK